MATRPSNDPGSAPPTAPVTGHPGRGFAGILNRHPAVGLALGVVRNGSLEYFYEHGLADIASNTPIAKNTVFRIGSITKTFTAITVMQL